MENLFEIKTTQTKFAYEIKNAELTVAKKEKIKADQDLQQAYNEVQKATEKVNTAKLETQQTQQTQQANLPQAEGTATGIQAGLAGSVTTVTATPAKKLIFKNTQADQQNENANPLNAIANNGALGAGSKTSTLETANPLPKTDILSAEAKYLNEVKEQFNARISTRNFVSTKSTTDLAPNKFGLEYRNQSRNLSVIDKATKTYEDVMKKFDFTPGEFNLEIIEKGGVEVNYVGGYTYVPPSSDPNYEEGN
jgi:hypothetical protein